MTLLKCYECSGKVSSEADSCPHCGAPVRKEPAERLENTIISPDSRKAKTGRINVSDEEWAQMRAKGERLKKLRKHRTSYSVPRKLNKGAGKKNGHTDSGKYIGNIRFHKFHRPDCHFAKKMASRNKVLFTTREEAIDQGCLPCKACEP